MTPERIRFLNLSQDARLTDRELDKGWHFCYDWDGLLVGPGTNEWDCCTCEWTKPLRLADKLEGKQ